MKDGLSDEARRKANQQLSGSKKGGTGKPKVNVEVEKTTRLRALRLAKEAADAAEIKAAPPKPVAKPRAKAKPKAPATRADA
jgi:2,3-bisphosphoglycerate-independent phosphoglycerate mutase